MIIRTDTHSCFINKCRAELQFCSYCGEKIGKGNYAFSLRKQCAMGSYNIWIHFNCLNGLSRVLRNAYNKNKGLIEKTMVVEKLK